MADEPKNPFQAMIEESERSGKRPKEFQPGFRYLRPPMDGLIYLTEDVTFVAQPVDPYVTLLVHGHEHHIVGVRFEGARRMFARLQDDLPNDTPTLFDITRAVQKRFGKWSSGGMADVEKERAVRNGYIAANTFAKLNDVPLPEGTLEEVLEQ